MFHLKVWQFTLLVISALAVLSIAFGVWGFIAAWAALGSIALAAHIMTRGRPIEPYAPGLSLFLLVLSGPFGFWIILQELICYRKERTAVLGKNI